ncbi:electron transfer flavoprotein subunit alpha [Lutibacter sp. B1]|uniref:electron transfer flavoprotein subunit beta/FixA family protein n=1 Tax=Lutibacter sp. B1 TaxID=2725996 RepID=UPI0014570C7E|nr:electron transfer flavoprotein subunit alpha [Lutibacter sp. B1]NLP59260.1 electron transfer flavoprotein subunit alpha [Lutibacter sp. B1]
MKIAVIYKWARDPEAASVRADGSIDWRGAKMMAGEDDPAALDAAKTIAEGSVAQIIGITIGDGDASWILARGVNETLSVIDAPSLSDQAITGEILASAVNKLGDIDVVAIGDPHSYSGVPVTLAGTLGWPALMGLTTAKTEEGKIIATKKNGNEEKQITISTPVVLGFVAESEEKKVPGMKEKLMARKRPITKITISDLGLSSIKDRINIDSSRVPEEKQAHLFEGEPSNAVGQLVETLRKEGVL